MDAVHEVFDNVDLVYEISTHLNFKQKYKIFLINRACYTARESRPVIPTRNGVSLYMGKEKVLADIIRSTESLVSVKAPPSYGKTLLEVLTAIGYVRSGGAAYKFGYDVAQNADRVLYIVPPKALRTVIDDINKHFPGAIDLMNPTTSPILIGDRAYPRHYNYLEKTGYSPKTKIIVRTTAKFLAMIRPIRDAMYTFRWMGRSRAVVNQRNNVPYTLRDEMNVMTVIVDESHTTHCAYWALDIGCPKVIGFSATEHVTDGRRENQCAPTFIRKDITVSHAVLEDTIPTYTLRPSIESFEKIVADMLTRYDHIVIFIYARFSLYTDRLHGFNGTVYKFKRDTKVLSDFRNHQGKALLITRYGSADVAVSIAADAAILTDADSISANRLHQITGRLLRITNNAPSVDMVAMFSAESWVGAKLQLALMNVMRFHDVSVSSTDKRGMNKLVTELSLDVDTLSDIELIYYAAPRSRNMKELYTKHGLLDPKRHQRVLHLLNYEPILIEGMPWNAAGKL